MKPRDFAIYVSLSNIYVAANMPEDVARVRKMMTDYGLKKELGQNWTDVNNTVHEFILDNSHSQAEEIYKMLERLSNQTRDAGYVPNRDFVLHDIENE